MTLKLSTLLLTGVALVMPVRPLAGALGPEAAACRSGSRTSAVRVLLGGFKKRAGEVQFRVYDDPRRFLAKGQRLKRVTVPVTASGPLEVCIALPKAGRYAIAVHHDLEADGGKDWNDGGAYSGNPRLSLLRLKPSFDQAAFVVGSQPATIRITLLYRRGLSIGPVAHPVE
ncbi:MAG: hypothetical protein JWM38_927 [Sphingomonas bacterium]|nr:hypothetical protein [Sphingomonas bacterium]MDB5684755.1 hypothetical protein [Sphingomonas bacterium]MDB5717500.1 hypothetical protein [Sphingomonas bacterium]